MAAFFKMIRSLGLDEDVPDSPGTTRPTALGKELKLDLVMAFVGAWELREIPYILEKYGHIDESQAEELCIREHPLDLGQLLGKHITEVAPGTAWDGLPIAEEYKDPATGSAPPLGSGPRCFCGWDA